MLQILRQNQAAVARASKCLVYRWVNVCDTTQNAMGDDDYRWRRLVNRVYSTLCHYSLPTPSPVGWEWHRDWMRSNCMISTTVPRCYMCHTSCALAVNISKHTVTSPDLPRPWNRSVQRIDSTRLKIHRSTRLCTAIHPKMLSRKCYQSWPATWLLFQISWWPYMYASAN